MAEIQFENSSPDSSAMDFPAHQKTYNLFVGLVKWNIIALVVLLSLMALTLV